MLRNPHNKVKTGYGPVEAAAEAASSSKPIGLHRSRTLGAKDVYNGRAADDLLLKFDDAIGHGIFTRLDLFAGPNIKPRVIFDEEK